MSGNLCKLQLVFWRIFFFFGGISGISERIRFVRQVRPGFLKQLALHPGKLGDLYKRLCTLEQEQAAKNPESKSPYKEIFGQAQQLCIAFQNEANSVKVHLPKNPSKSRGKKAPKVEPPESDDD